MMNDSQKQTAAGEDWMDALLRAESRERASDYLSDDGFTARVLAVLPAVSSLPAWRKPLVALLWTFVAVASLVAMPGIADDVLRGVAGLIFGHRLSFTEIAAAITLLGAVTWSALVYAARTD